MASTTSRPRCTSDTLAAGVRASDEEGCANASRSHVRTLGPIRARWFDPTTGNYIAISNGYEYENAGQRTFTTPGSRSDGTDDWVLVLDSTGNARCGSITPSGRTPLPGSSPSGDLRGHRVAQDGSVGRVSSSRA